MHAVCICICICVRICIGICILSTVQLPEKLASQPDATHIHTGEKPMHASFLPAPANHFLAVILWGAASQGLGVPIPKPKAALFLRIISYNCCLYSVGWILPVVAGQMRRQIGILQNNRTLASDQCEGNFVRYLMSNQLGI